MMAVVSQSSGRYTNEQAMVIVDSFYFAAGIAIPAALNAGLFVLYSKHSIATEPVDLRAVDVEAFIMFSRLTL